jgi:chromosome segregation ATPase
MSHEWVFGLAVFLAAWLAVRGVSPGHAVLVDLVIAGLFSLGVVSLLRRGRSRRTGRGAVSLEETRELARALRERLAALRATLETVSNYAREVDRVAKQAERELAAETRPEVRATLEENLATYRSMAATQQRWRHALERLTELVSQQRDILEQRLVAWELVLRSPQPGAALGADLREWVAELAHLDAEVAKITSATESLADRAAAVVEVETLVKRWQR